MKVPQNPAQTAAIRITGCARCAKRWSGGNTSHCGGCHHTFTGISAFSAHRQGSYARGTRHCTPPETVGLTDAGRAYPCWGLPTDGAEWWTEEETR